jgi:hypothetical protein
LLPKQNKKQKQIFFLWNPDKTTALLEQEEEQYRTGPEAKCEVQTHLQVTSKMRIKVRLDDVPPPHD